jgi:hypothetical protein
MGRHETDQILTVRPCADCWSTRDRARCHTGHPGLCDVSDSAARGAQQLQLSSRHTHRIFFEPLQGTIEVDSPDSVKFGEDFKIVIKLPDNLTANVPQNIDGLRVIELTATRLSYNLPTNATFHSASLKGGSGFSGADVDEIDNALRETIRSPIPAGEQFLFPSLIIKVEADFPDTEIVTTAAGTSFDNPGFEFDFKVQDTGGSIFRVTESCFPDQASVVVSTIQVGSENNNNNNNGEHHGNKPHKPHWPYKQHKVCD